MSRRRGRGSRHDNSRKNEKYGGCSEEKNDNSATCKEQFRRVDRGRPPGLRGKAIGLYYRDKQRKKNNRKLTVNLNLYTVEKVYNLVRSQSTSHDIHSSIKEENNCSHNDIERKYNYINDSSFKRKFLDIVNGNLQDNIEKSVTTNRVLQNNETLNTELLHELNRNKHSDQYKKILRFRKNLPAYEKQKEILDLINANQVVLISGETGCGKTTQVAQFILDKEIECNRGSTVYIACTQPRRISAISVAERVAAERADRLGNSVGYHIRLEKKLPRRPGSIVFCTTAMLLQFMQTDPALWNYSHIILDEIHERSTQSDFILSLLKQIIPKRPDLKVILMSATLNSDKFSKYFNNCPLIHIPGFTYPVEEFYLEDVLSLTRFQFPVDSVPKFNYKKYKNKKQSEKEFYKFQEFIGPYIRNLEYSNAYPGYVLEQLQNPKSEHLSFDLIVELVKYICFYKGPGAILIFLPGLMDISKLNRLLLQCGCFPSDRYVIYPLHSKMPTMDQKQIFEVPPSGVRKIIIATAIAETSITVEDVVYVVDCGKTKLSRFDVTNNLQILEAEWVSEANVQQRKGRAGRVRPGICYHLFSKARASTLEHYPLPEMLRTRLEEVILQIKILQIGKADIFLATLMDPPNPQAISLSLDLLTQLKALDEKENLTPLGYHLAHLPLDPRTGKMILWAALFSCIDPVFGIAASLSFKDAFYCPLGMEDQARKKKLELSKSQLSDHLVLAEALNQFENQKYRRNEHSFCREYFLSWNTLKLLSDMKQQFATYLYEMKFLRNANVQDDSANKNSYNLSLIRAIVCAGLYPNIAVVKGASGRHSVTATTTEGEKVKVHPSSVNEKVKSFPSPYLTYFLKQKSSGIYLFDTTCVSAVALLFASPTNIFNRVNSNCEITIAKNISFQFQPTTAKLMQKLHDKLDSILEYKISHPDTIDWNTHDGSILKIIIEILSEYDETLGLDSGRMFTRKNHNFF